MPGAGTAALAAIGGDHGGIVATRGITAGCRAVAGNRWRFCPRSSSYCDIGAGDPEGSLLRLRGHSAKIGFCASRIQTWPGGYKQRIVGPPSATVPSAHVTILRRNSGSSCRWLRVIPSLGTSLRSLRELRLASHANSIVAKERRLPRRSFSGGGRGDPQCGLRVAQPRQTVRAKRVRRSLLAKTDWRSKAPGRGLKRAPHFSRFTTVKQPFVIASDVSAVARRAKAEAKQSRMLPRRQSGLLRRLRSSQ
jgi:hypothetical protein